METDTSKDQNNVMTETRMNMTDAQASAPLNLDGHVRTLIPSLETQLLAFPFAEMERTLEQKSVTMEISLIT